MVELTKELERLKGTCEGDDFKSITVKSDFTKVLMPWTKI